MDATTSRLNARPRWLRHLAHRVRRGEFTRLAEIVVALALLATLIASYILLRDESRPGELLTPPVVALLLVANLVPALAMMVLVARRFAQRRAAMTEIGGRGRLHTRLVALFSIIAAVPTVLVVIFASLLFQSGLDFWFSDRARTLLQNAENVAQVYGEENVSRVRLDTEAMGQDIVKAINEVGVDSDAFEAELLIQKVYRQLSEVALITVTSSGELQNRASVDLDARPLERRVSAAALSKLRAGETRVAADAGDRVEAVVRLDPEAEVYLYASRAANPAAIRQFNQARSAASDYRRTLDRSRALQFRFNALLLLISLLLVAATIWIALKVADRLVRPVGQLVGAARRVTAGDLSARVPASRVNDEVGTLGNAFNRMTRTLEEQTGALRTANAQLESRRAFIEAALGGVTAGVISIDRECRVRLINLSAEALLGAGEGSLVGRKLGELAPELEDFVSGEDREATVAVGRSGEPRTLAVKRVRVEGGHVLTFDDITDQLLAQRQAAWSDVARRIAHEIKNPLTPISLAAERLQRRYGQEITSDKETFERLTGTIVRQVGDLRRMVDEFSGFARMPRPVFAEERLVEIARNAIFLHEVAHPDISFALEAGDPGPSLVCDKRQLGQALTNILKNAVEAIGTRGSGEAPGEIVIRVAEEEGRPVVEIVDNGIGLPTERGRITEPYMTTRSRGTGLGLAIVKKIVEDHGGSIDFADAPGGGTRVRLSFDPEAVRASAAGAAVLESAALVPTQANGT